MRQDTPTLADCLAYVKQLKEMDEFGYSQNELRLIVMADEILALQRRLRQSAAK